MATATGAGIVQSQRLLPCHHMSAGFQILGPFSAFSGTLMGNWVGSEVEQPELELT